jgi:hypothetical protein
MSNSYQLPLKMKNECRCFVVAAAAVRLSQRQGDV